MAHFAIASSSASAACVPGSGLKIVLFSRPFKSSRKFFATGSMSDTKPVPTDRRSTNPPLPSSTVVKLLAIRITCLLCQLVSQQLECVRHVDESVARVFTPQASVDLVRGVSAGLF